MSFKARVQYGDFDGTAAADKADQNNLSDYLHTNGLMQSNEFLVAAKLWIGENHGGIVKKPTIHALVIDAPDYDGAVKDLLDQDLIPVRSIELHISLEQFIGFFKRFAVTLTLSGCDLASKDYQEI